MIYTNSPDSFSRRCSVSGLEFFVSPLEQQLCEFFEAPLRSSSRNEIFRTLFAFRSGKRFFLHTPAGETPFYSIYPQSGPIRVAADAHDGVGVREAGESIAVPRDLLKAFGALSSSIGRLPSLNRVCSELKISNGNVDCHGGYLLFDSENCNHCYYSSELVNCEGCVDCDRCFNCSGSYECQLSRGCRECAFVDFSFNCTACILAFGCKDCSNCIGCVGLEGKSFCLFNEQLTEVEYNRRVSELSIHSRQFFDAAVDRYYELIRSLAGVELVMRESEQSSGRFLHRCQMVEDSIATSSSSGSALLYSCSGIEASLNCVASRRVSRSFNIVGCRDGENLRYSINCGPGVSNLTYCLDCRDSSNLIGCVGLVGKEYCVLNTQLTKTQYGEFVSALKDDISFNKQAGRFLSLAMSPFAYNQSESAEHFPLNPVQAKLLGFRWDEGHEAIRPSEYVKDIGSNLKEISESAADFARESISKDVYICALSGRPFQLIGPELSLLEALKLPPPICCYDQRLLNRNRRLNLGCLPE